MVKVVILISQNVRYILSYPNNFEPVFKNFYRSPRVVYNNDFSNGPKYSKLESVFGYE